MKQKLLALGLCLGLLAGCGPDFSGYPHVSSQSQQVAAQALTMDIPRDADQLTLDAVAQFQAAVLELSGGAVTIETVPNENPVSALSHGATHLALATNRMLIEADSSLAFLDWPFLFRTPEEYLTVMGAEGGAVRGSGSLEKALGGQVIGLWYGGSTVLLGRGVFYEEICFSNATLGLLAGGHGSGFFTGIDENLGAKEVRTGTEDELLDLLTDRAIKYTEYPMSSLRPEELPESVKYLEYTTHRIQGMWLVLGSGAVDDSTARILRAAAAFVPEPALKARSAVESQLLDQLSEQGVKVHRGEYASLFRAAREYFGDHCQELGCSRRVWDKLYPLL